MSLDFGIREFSWREGRPSPHDQAHRATGKRGHLVQSARKLYEASGVRNTTVAAVCTEAGITRELFYYYFPNKDALTQAVLDDYVMDFTESVALWNESRVVGEIPVELKKYIRMFRRCLFDESNHERPMFRVARELGQSASVLSTAVCEMTRYLSEGAAAEYAKFHNLEIDFASEMIYSASFGIAGLLLVDPDISDDRLAMVYRQTLRLDMEPLDSQQLTQAASSGE